MSVFSSGTFIKNRSKGFTHLLFILLVSSLVVIVFGQTRWQDLTAFHPYCVRLFRSCVNSSSVGGVGSNDYDISVGICGNKMAICTSSGNLTWPWSSNFYFETNTLQFGLPRPASASIFAEGSRLITYRNILTSPPNVTATPWQNVTAFLPDCNAIFRRCVDTNSVVPDSIIIGGCGHGMSICTERQGRWPFGNESSTFWTQPYSNERLNVYRNAYSRDFNFARSWRSITDFHPLCRNLMAQCVSTSRDPSSNDTIGLCGNRMAICTSENILWPHSYDKSSAYTEPYDARWQRYATNLVDSTPRWLDIRRFSNICTDKFFECVYASPNATEDAVIGVCGNQMSICTFNNNIWPNVSEIPTTPDSYSTRLGIYHAMFDNMSPSAASYFTFPPLYWELYSFSTHTFTNAGATGRFGPTLSGTRRAYASQPWAQNSILFDTTTRGIQLWTVPATAWYRITCAGAKGGDAEAPGGNGAQMTGDFYLARATVIAIIVGQQGGVRGTNCNAGGGGGSFVWNTESTTEPLIAAGGGGGGLSHTFGSQGVISVNGTFSDTERTAGSNGMGGTPGGAGWKSHGGVGFGNSNTECWLLFRGGMNGTAQVGAGGFGGGAGAGGSPCTGGGGSGGGGGYSGGAGPSRTTLGGSGGGGGSYNNGTNQRNTAGANSGHGFVIITKL